MRRNPLLANSMSMIKALLLIIIGNGSSNTISISNTKKITANRKNRREKGRRADLFGSNPHSNGDAFSRSLVERALKVRVRKIIRLLRSLAIKIMSIVRCIVTWNG